MELQRLDVGRKWEADGNTAVVWLFDASNHKFRYHYGEPTQHGVMPQPLLSTASHVRGLSGPHHFNVWVSPRASEEKQMLRLEVGCVLRISGCKSIGSMAPEAWRKYEADQRLVNVAERGPQNELAIDPSCDSSIKSDSVVFADC